MTVQRRCAFLRMQDTDGWSIDADLAFAPLAKLGWRCEWLAWSTPEVDWDGWDVVYPAATWDYPEEPDAFLATLQAIDSSRATLVNDLELMRWNIPKTYLRELSRAGAAIVPSRWYDSYADCDLAADCAAFASDRIVLKPVISTNARDTFLLRPPVDAETESQLVTTFGDRPFLVQPFVDSIQSVGEYSLFFFGGDYSHAIRKVPRRNDFRVQEEHGADILAADPDEALRRTAERVMSLVQPVPLYARCDLVAGDSGYEVMELELIEPSLYLRMDPEAPARFAAAFDRHVTARQEAG